MNVESTTESSRPAPAPWRVVSAVRRRPVAAYFGLAFAISWAYWVPDVLAGGHWTHFPGLLGPALAAVVVSGCCGGRHLRDLAGTALRWRVPLRWYFASIVPLATAAAVIAIRWVATGRGPEPGLSRMAGTPDIGWLGVALVVLLVNGFGEELGWRGFAWSRMREQHSLPRAALLLAIPWAVWHAPTFWIDSGLSDISLPLLPGFFIGLAAGAVVLGWLYERTGSVVVVAVWHAALNMASATKATAVAAPFVSAVVIAWAIAIARRSAALDDQDGGVRRRRRSERTRRDAAAVTGEEELSRRLAPDTTASRPTRRRPRRHHEHAAPQRAPRSRQPP